MARSFWKGNSIIKDLLKPSYEVNKQLIKNLKIKTTLTDSSAFNHTLMVYRRNQVLLISQLMLLKQLTPFYIYNGYDFFKQTTTNFDDENLNKFRLNLASKILTREMNVVHKAKLTKAARVKQAGLKKKILFKKAGSKSSSTTQKYKSVLSKKFRK